MVLFKYLKLKIRDSEVLNNRNFHRQDGSLIISSQREYKRARFRRRYNKFILLKAILADLKMVPKIVVFIPYYPYKLVISILATFFMWLNDNT